jgi:hypothetical protein
LGKAGFGKHYTKELQSVRTYPDLKVAGQYQRLVASIDLKSIKYCNEPLSLMLLGRKPTHILPVLKSKQC